MHPRIAENQRRYFLQFWRELAPHLRTDSALPRRIKELLGRNRSIGSRDRRLYRELIYTALRFLPWVETLAASRPDDFVRAVAWLAPEQKETGAFRAAVLGDWPPCPAGASLAEKANSLSVLLKQKSQGGARPLDALRTRPAAGFHPDLEPQTLLPGWFREHCPAAFASPNLDALLDRAPIWVRLQCQDHSIVLDEFRSLGWDPVPHRLFPEAVRLAPNADVGRTDALRRGFVEIQDLGSQLVLAQAPIAPGQRWLDACAGAGGKTVQLARLVGDSGSVDAHDIRSEPLHELGERTARARLTNVRITNKPTGSYDGVLVDAPCSGSGTWRRLPHMKWQTTPELVAAFAADQLAILTANAAHVRPGGVLVYATCSLSARENHDVVAAFLNACSDFQTAPPARDCGGVFDGLGSTLLPATHDTDGFYTAVITRKSG